MKYNTKRKLISLLLIFVLISSLYPVSAFATKTDGGAAHTHTDACYETKLVCEQPEGEGHTHTEECYTTPTEPLCGSEEHVHDDSCYPKELVCAEEESDTHSHGDDCYNIPENPQCAKEEHSHDASCYPKELVCGLEEAEGHTHAESCYEQSLICDRGSETGDIQILSAVGVQSMIDALPSVGELAEMTKEERDKAYTQYLEACTAYDGLSREEQTKVDDSLLNELNEWFNEQLKPTDDISEDDVASVNGVGYDSLSEAYKAAQGGDTIVLLKDTNVGSNYLLIQKAITIDLNGHSIQSDADYCVIWVYTDGDLTLTGNGSVSGANMPHTYGNIMNYAKLTIEDNVRIENNTASNGYGGAVYNTGTFIMNGGTIQNTSNWGGGAVYNTGTFTMNGGTIKNTSATNYGGAVYNKGTFELTNGLIDGCKTTSTSGYGGAVYNEGVAVIESGMISGCETTCGGGGVHLESGSFTMDGGTIESCKVTDYQFSWDDPDEASNGGGGVSVRTTAEFTMNDGLIWKNVSLGGDGGGGVTNDGVFTMTGGQIIMNKAVGASQIADDGGGVNNEIGTMTMTGGIIAKNEGRGGIYSGSQESKLTITGGAVFENYALQIFGSNPPEENKKVDIILNTNHKTNNGVSVCAASDMSADGYIFTAWNYIGEGWSFANPYVGTIIDGVLLPIDGVEFNDANTHAYFRTVFTSPETEQKEGIYLGGTFSEDSNDGTSVGDAVRTFERAWELAKEALESEEETATIYICGEVKVSDDETWGDDTPGNIVVMRAADYTGALVKVDRGGELTLKNITIDGNKGTYYTDSLIHVDGGELFIQEGAILQNNLAGRTEKGYDGGAVYIEGGSGEMTGGTIRSNTARNNGGGVSVSEGGAFTISGGTITGNEASYGGGICAVRGSHIFVTDDALISDNHAAYGGGVNLGAYSAAEAYYGSEHPKQTLEMSGGSISENRAQANGGGIFVQMNSTATITEGYITENKIDGGVHKYHGAGIYVNGGRGAYVFDTYEALPNGLLQLYNVEMSGNGANEYGGALAACPTANVKIYVTDGAVLYNNSTKSGSARDVYIEKSKDETSTSYVSDFMLGGGMYQWLWRGDVRAEQSQYQNSADEVLLSGLCDKDDVSKAVALAKVHITGNQTLGGSGGGIGSNGDVVIGTPPDEEETNASITIAKAWEDNEDFYGKRPSSITVDVQYGEYTLRGIELTAENNWTATLQNMPNAILEQANPELKILELNCGEYYSQSGVVAQLSGDGKTLTISITNQMNPLKGNLTVGKIVSGSGDTNKDFTFTVTLDQTDITGEFGGMTFTDGVATFTLKHNESMTATGLPAGIGFTVTEGDNSGYTVTSVEGTTTAGGTITGTIPAEDTAEVIFNNYKSGGGGGPGDSYTSLSVKKIWELDDGGTAADSVKVALLRNGAVDDTVILSDSNGWAYQWNRLNDSYVWTVMEVDTPEGFTSTISHKGNTWTITNDDSPKDPTDPIDPVDPTDPVDPVDPIDPTDPVDPIEPVDPTDPVTDPIDPEKPEQPTLPQTGQLWWPAALALLMGLILLLAGLWEKKRYHGKYEK